MERPKFTVTVEGQTHTAVIEQGDMTRWEMARHANGWPDMGDAPNLYMTHVCWSALKRQGAIPKDMPLDYFIDVLSDFRMEASETVDPTPPAPTPGS